MACAELQEEELEVLHSIFEGDECFKEINPTTFQYKYGEDASYKSFLLEVSWGDNYPEEAPLVTMDAFYNKHVNEYVKQHIIAQVLEQAADNLDSAMTYTLFDWVKENVDSLLVHQSDAPFQIQVESKPSNDIIEERMGKKKERKEQLTKAQKRRQFDKFGHQSDKPRGWDWVDVIKHLAKSGRQATEDADG